MCAALREAMGEHWSPDYRNELAKHYGNRAVLLAEQGHPQEALGDYARAIELDEVLREAMGEHWPPDYRNGLARHYGNRAKIGRAHV